MRAASATIRPACGPAACLPIRHLPVVRGDALIFDVRTLLEADEDAIEQAVGFALEAAGRVE